MTHTPGTIIDPDPPKLTVEDLLIEIDSELSILTKKWVNMAKGDKKMMDQTPHKVEYHTASARLGRLLSCAFDLEVIMVKIAKMNS